MFDSEYIFDSGVGVTLLEGLLTDVDDDDFDATVGFDGGFNADFDAADVDTDVDTDLDTEVDTEVDTDVDDVSVVDTDVLVFGFIFGVRLLVSVSL